MRATDDETLSHPDYPLQNMYHPTTNHYITPTYFAPPSHPGHMHIVAQLPRPTNAPPQRKRPKYTRSKTGCLTCRAKKIKCDETKPNCMRCTHGQRECTWPEGVPARKKPAPKKQQTPSASDNRPSTAGSSGISDTSTPPTRNSTPPKEEQQTPDLNLPPMATRRHSEPYITLQPAPDSGVVRRQSIASLVQGSSSHGYQMHSTHSHILPVIPEMTPSYATLPRYNTAYSTPLHAHSPVHSIDSVSVPSRPSTSSSSGVRRVDHHHHSPHPHQMSQWANHAQPSVMVHMDPIEPYFHTVQERNLVGYPSSNNQQFRYQ